jgi:hypothetical protein
VFALLYLNYTIFRNICKWDIDEKEKISQQFVRRLGKKERIKP